jgi:hypothetical protein
MICVPGDIKVQKAFRRVMSGSERRCVGRDRPPWAHSFRRRDRPGMAASGRDRPVAEGIAIVSKGRRADLEGMPREGPDSARRRSCWVEERAVTVDPEHAFLVDFRYGRTAPKTGLFGVVREARARHLRTVGDENEMNVLWHRAIGKRSPRFARGYSSLYNQELDCHRRR